MADAESPQELKQTQQELLRTAKETHSNVIESYMHALIVLFVLASATALRVTNSLDVQTISTVYGAALGFATGLTVKRGN